MADRGTHCGHDAAQFVTAGEGTSYCPACEDAARSMSHAERVAANFAPDSVEHQVALYHDHIEDDLGPVPPEIVARVAVLSRGKDEDYKAYIARIKASGDPVVVAVKIADARDNLARCRGEHDGKVDSNRARRYEYVLKQLGAS